MNVYKVIKQMLTKKDSKRMNTQLSHDELVYAYV